MSLKKRAQPVGPVEFLVHRVVRGDEHGLVVEGRVGRGALHLGATLSSALTRTPTGEDGTAGADEHPRPLSLRVAEVEAYGRTWKALEAGMTARVTLHGEGGCCVRDHDVLTL